MKGFPNENSSKAEGEVAVMSFREGDVIVRFDATYPGDALVVDGFDDEQNLLAHPLGGGLQFIIPRVEIPRFQAASDFERTSVYHKARFSIEGIDEEFEGWSDGRNWNGWARPHFEFLHAQRVVSALDPKNGRFVAAADCFVTVTADEDPETWPAETIALPDGGAVKVYPIGAGSWIWEESEQEESSL